MTQGGMECVGREVCRLKEGCWQLLRIGLYREWKQRDWTRNGVKACYP